MSLKIPAYLFSIKAKGLFFLRGELAEYCTALQLEKLIRKVNAEMEKHIIKDVPSFDIEPANNGLEHAILNIYNSPDCKVASVNLAMIRDDITHAPTLTFVENSWGSLPKAITSGMTRTAELKSHTDRLEPMMSITKFQLLKCYVESLEKVAEMRGERFNFELEIIDTGLEIRTMQFDKHFSRFELPVQ